MGEMYSTERLSEVARGLAGRSQEAALRVQLHALAGVLANLDVEGPDPDLRADLERRIDSGMEAGDEDAVLTAMAELAALERAPLRWVDWSAASSG